MAPILLLFVTTGSIFILQDAGGKKIISDCPVPILPIAFARTQKDWDSTFAIAPMLLALLPTLTSLWVW